MPRIDPLQLLVCLAVLLSPEGGILSHQEVPRLVNLMTKFSKKLVSKCVYILILKNTERSLVNLFMAEGGWNLIHTWLQDAIHISNWDLVNEILTLLLITPVDVERLKLNNIPKLVKSLSRLEDVKGVQELSTQLVHDWLVIVKGSTTKAEEQVKVQTDIIKTENTEINDKIISGNEIISDTVDSSQIKAENNDDNENSSVAIPTTTFYKVTVRDGKQVISKTEEPPNIQASLADVAAAEAAAAISDDTNIEIKEKKDDKSKSSSSSKSKSRSSSSSKHSSSSSSSSSRSKSSSSSSSSKHKSSSSKSSSSRDKDKDRDKDRKDRDKHRSNGSKSSSSSSNKSESKEKQAEKDKDTLAKLKPQSIEKIGRIPKKTDDKKEVRKPTMSIEVRKNNEERPKTVKVFNSKRRSTGLEEEAKPPPPRPVPKKPTTPVVIPPLKRPSPPPRDPIPPPEKRPRVEVAERPGAIKLIPPKPKPPVLQESDIFMDALTASATPKKETKKRKRRPSVTKDTPGSPTTAPDTPTSPLGLKNIAAPNFYQDTLENSEETPAEPEKQETEERSSTPVEETEPAVERTRINDGIKGVLVHNKRKGAKKSVKFNDANLTQVRFFELDETERVNVTKNFMDMAKMDMSSEREALQMSRKLANEDIMEPQTIWRLPFLIDQKEPLAVPGSKSLEKDIQFAREKSVLQALYFDKRKIPDSADEPIPENHQMSDPITIPLEDAESQEIDLTSTPWPEPKGSPPPPVQDNLPPQIFQNMPMPFQNFNNRPGGGGPPPNFQGMGPPRFPGPFMPNGNMMGPNMGPPPDMMHNQGPLNPTAFGPGPPGPDNFNNMMNDNNFGMPPFNNQPMFPPNNFNMRGRGGQGGGFRRGGGNNGPWIRMNGPPQGNWNNRGGGGGGGGVRGGRICKNVKNHGFCRNMDKCPFVHPK